MLQSQLSDALAPLQHCAFSCLNFVKMEKKLKPLTCTQNLGALCAIDLGTGTNNLVSGGKIQIGILKFISV